MLPQEIFEWIKRCIKKSSLAAIPENLVEYAEIVGSCLEIMMLFYRY